MSTGTSTSKRICENGVDHVDGVKRRRKDLVIEWSRTTGDMCRDRGGDVVDTLL